METKNSYPLLEKAKEFAIICHQSTNHWYDGRPYSYHLMMVNEAAQKFIHLIPEQDREVVLSACWVHDVIEDTRMTYNDVKTVLGEKVADIAYALTNEKGKNRAERANDKYYEGIRNTPHATFVKLCDRIANIQHSKNTASSMLKKYAKENPNFQQKLFFSDEALGLTEMFVFIHELLAD